LSHGFTTELPVFITETGWKAGARYDLNPDMVAQHMVDAYMDTWLPDPRIVAVTPFVLNYQQDPFLGFSWRQKGDGFYPVYEAIRSLQKKKGQPEFKDQLTLLTHMPSVVTADSTIMFVIGVRNDGESTINTSEEYQYIIDILPEGMRYTVSDFSTIEPGKQGQLLVTITSPSKGGDYILTPSLAHYSKSTWTMGEWKLRVVPKTALTVIISVLFGALKQHSDLNVQILDSQNRLVFSRSGVKLSNGAIQLDGIANIIVGDQYKVVVSRRGYSPREETIIMQESNNTLKMRPLIPESFARKVLRT